MATQEDVLKVLSEKEGPTSATDIAQEIKSTRQTVTTLLHKLKGKGMVEGGGTEWVITDNGKTGADTGGAIPTTTADIGLDELSKFKHHGQLSSVEHDTITAAAELFQEGDMRSMEYFDSVMASMSVPPTQRTRWRALYLSFLRSSTPEETRDATYPLPPPAVPVAPAVAQGVATIVGEEARDWIVEGIDIHRAGEGWGEFTWREALQSVAAKRGAAPQPQDGSSSLKDLAEALKVLNPDPAKPLTGEGLLDLVSKIDEMRGGGDAPPPSYYIDSEGNKIPLTPGEPVVIKQTPPPAAQPGKSYFLNPETQQLEEIEAGKPIVITLKQGGDGAGQLPFPVLGNDNKPVYDKDGNPVIANLEPLMKWLSFQADQRRANEKHSAGISLVTTIKENLADGVSALKAAAEEAKGTGTKTPAAEPKQQVFSCGDCQTQFSAPAGWAGQALKCPNADCGREYTKEELVG